MKGKVIKYAQDNIDTDVILPGPYLKLHEHAELAEHAMEGLDSEFHSKVKNANIIVTGNNFGCGSSREHAVWALKDFGFKVIIAPSFADIFFSNCFKNGVLPIILDVTQVEKLLKVQDSVELDLNSQKITFGNESITFEIDSHRKTRLLEGLDDIDLTLKEDEKIENFEKNSSRISIFE